MITIIVPVYNAEMYIKRCAASVEAQNYTDWELIFVNDGSKDQSGRICEELADKDPRIHVIHQENQGASAARRNGIKQAQGEYLAFIDCDDTVEPTYISVMYEALQEKHTQIAACNMIRHREGETIASPVVPLPTLIKEKELFKRFFRYEFWGFPGKIYHKSVFQDIHIPDYTINEDYVVMLQIFHKQKEMAFVDAPLYHYISHDESLSHQPISNRAMEEYYNKVWAYDYCVKNLPTYTPHAEAQVTETCIKLLRMIREGKKKQEFQTEYTAMRSFLKSHLWSLLTNQHLLLGLKVMAIKQIL